MKIGRAVGGPLDGKTLSSTCGKSDCFKSPPRDEHDISLYRFDGYRWIFEERSFAE
jgi:hypothetical protein